MKKSESFILFKKIQDYFLKTFEILVNKNSMEFIKYAVNRDLIIVELEKSNLDSTTKIIFGELIGDIHRASRTVLNMI